MFTRSELEYKIKVFNAQLTLRVIAFSIAVVVPTWVGAAILQRMGFSRGLEAALRPVGVILLSAYLLGIWRVVKRTIRDHELICPKCGRALGFQAEKTLKTSLCGCCGEKIVD